MSTAIELKFNLGLEFLCVVPAEVVAELRKHAANPGDGSLIWQEALKAVPEGADDHTFMQILTGEIMGRVAHNELPRFMHPGIDCAIKRVLYEDARPIEPGPEVQVQVLEVKRK